LDPGMIKASAEHPVLTRFNRNAFANARLHTVQSGALVPGPPRDLVVEAERSLRAKRAAPESFKVGQVSVVNLDADKFLREIQGIYDVVIIDFPDPRSIELAKLYAKEFYIKLRQVLADDGVFAVQSTSAYYSREPFLMIGRTIEAAGFKVLPYHHEVPSFGDWGWHLGWKDERSVEAVKDQLRAAQSFRVATEYITPELVRSSLEFGKGVLEPTEQGTSSYMEPKLLALYLNSWVID